MPGKYQYDIELKSNVAKLLTDMKEVQDRLDTVEGKEYKIKLNVDEKKLSNVISNLEKMLDSLGKGTGDFKQFENLSKELSSIVSEVQNLSKAFGKLDDSGTKTLLSSIQNIDKSLSELSQHILNVNKNMSNIDGNTNGAVKQVENISNAYDNAAKSAEKLAEAQSKIGNKSNISSATQTKDVFQGDKIDQVTTSAKELDNTLEQVNIPTDSFDDVLSKLDLTESKLKEIVKITKQSVSDSEGKFNDSYTLKDKRGSTEIYGLSSNTEKGQLLRSNIVEYDAKEIEKANKQILKSEQELQAQKDAFHKKNLTAIDLEIQKREEESKMFSSALKAQMEERQKDISSMESSLKSFNESSKQLSAKPDDQHQFSSWKKQLEDLNIEIAEYKSKVENLSKIDISNEEQIKKAKTEIENLGKSIKETINTMTKTPQAKRGWTDIGASKAAEKVANVLKQNTKMSKEARDAIRAYYNELRSGNPSQPIDEILVKVNQLVQKERELGRVGKSFGEIFKEKVIYGGAAQLAGMVGFYDLINVGREGINTLKEFDDGLTKISYTMDMTKSQLDGLGKSVLEMANDLDSSIDNAMQVSQIYANMNTSAEEIKKLSEPTLILSNLTGFDASTVADDIQAVTQQFDIAAESSMHIADVYDQISRNISVDYSKILELILETI